MIYEPLFPEDWKRMPLWDTATYINGLAFKKIHFSTTGTPIIKISELKNGINPTTGFTNQTFDKKYEIKNGSIIYSWSGSPETSLDVHRWNGDAGWLNQHLFKVIANDFIDENFLIYILRYIKPNLIAIAKNKQTRYQRLLKSLI